MATRSFPISLVQVHKRRILDVAIRVPPLRVTAIAVVAVLILFRWLHLVLALEIASTGRQVLNHAEELQRIERANAQLQRAIAEAESPRLLGQRAKELGYAPGAPAYVTLCGLELSHSSSTGERPVAPDAGTPLGPVSSDSGAFAIWLNGAPTP